ncbi:MAG: oligoendopeptidase [Deltaproteobacteria bacterium]|nr:MAG: oligoendopeptidase [Deltaproteobacteria bacterium]
MSTPPPQNWNLDSIFDGGVTGPAFQERLAQAEADVQALTAAADALGDPARDPAWESVLPALDALERRIHELSSFTGCLAAAHAEDEDIQAAEQRVSALAARLERAWSRPTDLVARCSDDAFAALCARPALADQVGLLEEARRRRPVLLPAGEQALFDELADDALHGWGQLYRRTSGRLRVEVDGRSLSVAQAFNLLESSDAALRHRVFQATEAAWESVEETCATTLSRIIGVRRTLHDRLGVDELAIPLVRQRIDRATLDALITACTRGRALIWRYFAARSRLLGRTTYDWPDMLAPLGSAETTVDWPTAARMVIDTVGSFSDEMGRFFEMALQSGWVEAEDRPGKRAGAFCASFPESAESRVFMTFGGGPNSVRTLAHELGHAYHNWVMRDLPTGDRRLTSCLAETASTFAESLVRQAQLADATDPDTRLDLVDRELADAAVFIVNIPLRYEFERRLFELRAEGPLRAERLSAEMTALQRRWYGPHLGIAHPHFWAAKLHFFLTRAPFYNFPYSYGYLFSAMVHQRAMAEGSAWARTWPTLLRATGRGASEDVAARFLGVDLRDPASWQAVIDRLEPLVEEMEARAPAG